MSNGRYAAHRRKSKTSKEEYRIMKAVGIVRRIDQLGRVVIPKETRTILNIESGDSLEIYTNNDTIVLRKYEKSCIFCGNDDESTLTNYNDKLICKSCHDKIAARFAEAKAEE